MYTSFVKACTIFVKVVSSPLLPFFFLEDNYKDQYENKAAKLNVQMEKIQSHGHNSNTPIQCICINGCLCRFQFMSRPSTGV